MTTRMARIDRMTAAPPSVTTRRASPSSSSRRPARMRGTRSGRAGTTGPPALSASTWLATPRPCYPFAPGTRCFIDTPLLDLPELFRRARPRNREVAILHHDLLALLRQDQLHELPGQRIERLVGRPVDVHVEEPGQRVPGSVGLVGVGLVTEVPLLLRQRDRPHTGG